MDGESNRKRRQNGTESIKNKRKRLSTSGLEYFTYSGVLIHPKQAPGETVCKCKLQCKEIPLEQKQHLFEEFYKVLDPTKQKTYLLGLIQVGNIKRRRHGTYDNPAQSRRQVSVYYAVPNGKGSHTPVCRKSFANIFALSSKKLQGLVEKKKSGAYVYRDNRGKANKPRKFKPEIKTQVIAHIESFPREENHYSRSKSTKEFLSPDLNINRLFIAFQKKYPDTVVNYRFYSDVFHQEFPHLRFGKPKSDTCSKCDLMNNQIKATNGQEQRCIKVNLELHQRRAELAREKMKADYVSSQEPTSDTLAISIDLEQVIFTPTLTHSDMFYSRQLSNYNLGVHVADANTAIMCLWNESISGRGGNEIGSVLLKTLLTKPVFETKRNLTIWCDNCIGQNKNRMLLMVFIYLVAIGRFKQINQKFLVSGHSYLPCDRDFAQIEKRKRVCKLYIPKDIENMITSARHKNPFQVSHMLKDDFKNLQKFADEFISTTKLQISQASWIQITEDNPVVVKVRKNFSEVAVWETTKVLKKGKNLQDIKNYHIEQLTCQNRISALKLTDLKNMLDYIPLKHYHFYEKLIKDSEQQVSNPNDNQESENSSGN